MTANFAANCYSVIAWPGNKSQATPWVVDHLPAHRTWVALCAGAAGVTANKPPSHVEIYNDVDDDLVNFFRVLADRGDELVERLRYVPYSRSLFEKWERRWYDEDWRPDDPVDRAAVLFALQQLCFGGKARGRSYFATSSTRSQARTFEAQIGRLERFADRFRGVTIECLDWRDCLARYDSPETLFYADPPYPDAKPRYPHSDVDHAALADALADCDGEWVASYETVPAPIREVATAVRSRQTVRGMGAGHTGSKAATTEHLVLSFDPEAMDPFVERQATIESFAGPTSDTTTTERDR